MARADSVIEGRLVYNSRKAMGEALAKEHPADADMVIGVPDSGIPAAVGYAEQSGIPFEEGLIKNRYVLRTFIMPDQRLRDMGARMKYNPLIQNIKGKRLVVVDDSIVRGTTQAQLVAMLRARRRQRGAPANSLAPDQASLLPGRGLPDTRGASRVQHGNRRDSRNRGGRLSRIPEHRRPAQGDRNG